MATTQLINSLHPKSYQPQISPHKTKTCQDVIISKVYSAATRTKATLEIFLQIDQQLSRDETIEWSQFETFRFNDWKASV